MGRMGAGRGIVDGVKWVVVTCDMAFVTHPIGPRGNLTQGVNTSATQSLRCVQLAFICDIVLRMSSSPFWECVILGISSNNCDTFLSFLSPSRPLSVRGLV